MKSELPVPKNVKVLIAIYRTVGEQFVEYELRECLGFGLLIMSNLFTD